VQLPFQPPLLSPLTHLPQHISRKIYDNTYFIIIPADIMKFAVFSTLIAAAVAAVIPRQTGNGLNTFTLKAQSVAPDPLPSFGNLQWLNNRTTFTNPEPIGWFNATHTPLELFIQYNALEGTAFYSHDTALTVYLRPEDADGLSEVVLGNPEVCFSPSCHPVVRRGRC
jgi:hypothetical protein